MNVKVLSTQPAGQMPARSPERPAPARPQSLRKADVLDHWQTLPANQPVRPQPVPYKHEGSTYAEDGIRITGSRRFIDSVLSRLKDVLAYENGQSRLQVSYKQSTDRATGNPVDSWNCYVQVHERGGRAW